MRVVGRVGSVPLRGVAVGVAIAGAALCSTGCEKATAAAATADMAQVAVPASHVEGNNYKVDSKLGDCAAGAECSGTIRLEALGAYHINDTYPYKFTVIGPDGGTGVDGLEFLGKDPTRRHVFGKDNGDFDKQAEKVAVLRVRFKAQKPGKVAFAGRFKLSVCSEANCQLEQADVSFEGPVK